MLLAKLVAAMVMVIAITWIAERVSSRFAGVLLGFPLGAGLSLLFIGLVQGADFAAQSAQWTTQGLLPTLIWCLSYRVLAEKLHRLYRPLAVLLSLLVSLFCYLPSTLLVMELAPSSLGLRLLLSLFALGIFSLLFRHGPQQENTICPQPVTGLILLGRALLTALIILAITSSAGYVGSHWSGVFSAFPATILPVVLILHSHYGSVILRPLFQQLPMGMLAIVVFSLAVAWSYPILGVGWGTIASYGIAMSYLLFYEFSFRKKVERQLDRLMGCNVANTSKKQGG
nr:hypothetical protein [uncultured Desulfobulbus sp.]